MAKKTITIKQNTRTIISTIVILLIVSFINILGIYYNQRWDFTENQLFTLSSHSQAVIEKLEKPLKVLIFDRDLDPDLESLLTKYRYVSQKFQFELINPEQELGLARQYEVQSLGEIYLEYGEKKQKVNLNNNSRGEILSEIQLTNSISKIQRDRIINIYLLQGHGEAPNQLVERGIAQAVKALRNQDNFVQELNLASKGKIPNQTNLIIIAGATRKLLDQEVASLQTYLSAGGNLLLLLSPNTDIGMTSLLSEWGIQLDNRLVVDGSGAGSIMGFGPGVTIVNQYGNHPITASLDNGTSIFPESRPLKILEKTGIENTPLIITNEQTWAESDLKNEKITFDSKRDISGPLNIAIAMQRDRPQVSRLVVFGSVTFATNGWIEQQLNQDILLNSVNWLTGENEETLVIQSQEILNRRINLTWAQAELINWLALRIMPVSALIIAIFIWFQGR